MDLKWWAFFFKKNIDISRKLSTFLVYRQFIDICSVSKTFKVCQYDIKNVIEKGKAENSVKSR